MKYEYKVIPAPRKGTKARAIKGAEARFAHAIETGLNELAIDGWEYWRSETLPSEERAGLTRSTTQWRTLLIFRRPKEAAVTTEDEATVALLAPPKSEMPDATVAAPAVAAVAATAAATVSAAKSEEADVAEEQADGTNASTPTEEATAEVTEPDTAPAAAEAEPAPVTTDTIRSDLKSVEDLMRARAAQYETE